MVFTVRSLRPEPIAIVTLALPLTVTRAGLSVVHQRLTTCTRHSHSSP